MSLERSSQSEIISLHQHTDSLYTFTIKRPQGFKFTAGQFARLGLVNAEQKAIFRGFSMVSSPFDDYLEFMATLVPDGEFSNCLRLIQIGDAIWIENIPYGFLTLTRYQSPLPKTLWLLATGTGVAPFLSILQTLDVWENYQQIRLVYSVRHHSELVYTQQIENWSQQYQAMAEKNIDFKYIPIVTREPSNSGHLLTCRIPEAIENGTLEQVADIDFDLHCHVMICGNPLMIEDTRQALMRHKQLVMNRRGVGNIAVENYW